MYIWKELGVLIVYMHSILKPQLFFTCGLRCVCFRGTKLTTIVGHAIQISPRWGEASAVPEVL